MPSSFYTPLVITNIILLLLVVLFYFTIIVVVFLVGTSIYNPQIYDKFFLRKWYELSKNHSLRVMGVLQRESSRENVINT